MLSAPGPGEYSKGQMHSLAGSGTFFIKQCLPPNTYDGQAVGLGVLPAVRQPSLRFCREELAPTPCVPALSLSFSLYLPFQMPPAMPPSKRS